MNYVFAEPGRYRVHVYQTTQTRLRGEGDGWITVTGEPLPPPESETLSGADSLGSLDGFGS